MPLEAKKKSIKIKTEFAAGNFLNHKYFYSFRYTNLYTVDNMHIKFSLSILKSLKE